MFRIIILIVVLFISITSHAAIVVGNARGSITLVEVFDYQCPHCQKMTVIVEKLMRNNPDLKVRLLPVAIDKHKLHLSLYQAAAAIAATQYDHAFDSFHASNMSIPPMKPAEVTLQLKKMKLLTPDFEKLMHSNYVKEQINEGLNCLETSKAGVPLFMIYQSNNPKASKVLKGEQTLSMLQQAIDHAKANK